MELGVLPGTRVQVVRVAPLGDPLELSARGCSLSIRKQDALLIDVIVERATAAIASSAAMPMQSGLPASS
jgi:hypothetical protein